MEKVIELFYQLQNTGSTLDKKSIISKNRDNLLFKRCLRFLTDPIITTGISYRKVDKNLSNYYGYVAELGAFEKVMDYLEEHNKGTDSDIASVQKFISLQPEEYRDFYRKMVTKKFRLGCDKKIINSVIPGLIPSWDVQQAFPLSEKNSPKANEWFSLSQKLNGNNCGYSRGFLVSRQGRIFLWLSHIIEDIQKLPFENMFFNGELIRKNTDNLPDDENFQIGTGIINSDEFIDKSCIKFVIYEMFPEEEFIEGESKLTYKQRYEKYLKPLDNEIRKLGLENIEVVKVVYSGSDATKINEYLQKADSDGWEGLMLNKDTTWKNKRNNGILKVKSFKHADVLCTGIAEGDGKYKGTMGLIKCDYKGFELGVGSGFTDEQRKHFWNHPEEIVGKIVQIKYKCETKNKQGGLSVQFPIFQIVRNDKTAPSYN